MKFLIFSFVGSLVFLVLGVILKFLYQKRLNPERVNPDSNTQINTTTAYGIITSNMQQIIVVD